MLPETSSTYTTQRLSRGRLRRVSARTDPTVSSGAMVSGGASTRSAAIGVVRAVAGAAAGATGTPRAARVIPAADESFGAADEALGATDEALGATDEALGAAASVIDSRRCEAGRRGRLPSSTAALEVTTPASARPASAAAAGELLPPP